MPNDNCVPARRADPTSALNTCDASSRSVFDNPLKCRANLTRAHAQVGSILHADQGLKLSAD